MSGGLWAGRAQSNMCEQWFLMRIEVRVRRIKAASAGGPGPVGSRASSVRVHIPSFHYDSPARGSAQPPSVIVRYNTFNIL